MREKRVGKIRHWIFFFTVVIMAVLGVFTALQAEPEPRNVREKGSSVNQWDTGWHYQEMCIRDSKKTEGFPGSKREDIKRGGAF